MKLMRGRFATDGALYTCGMFAWAGNATAPGGFYRNRSSEKPATVPLAIHAAKGALTITFSDPLDPNSVKPDAFAMKVWSLKQQKTTARNTMTNTRSPSPPCASAPTPASSRSPSPRSRRRTATNSPTNLRAPDGAAIEQSIHGTIRQLSEK